MTSDYLKSLGVGLIDQGYPIIPIKPGHKFPKGLKDWQSIVATEADVHRWSNNGFRGGGVGILTGDIVAVDIDVHDDETVEQILSWCEDNLGHAPQRVGKAPKTMLVFRAEKPFTKMTSKTFTDFLDFENRIEILGQGQQFVAYAVHPETGQPYRWVNGPGISDIRKNDLPIIDQDDAARLLSFFEDNCPSDWRIKTDRQGGETRRTYESFGRPKLGLSIDKIRETLEIIKELSDDYDQWVRVGMAVHHETDGSVDGFELFDDWSQHSLKYTPGETARKWSGFSNLPNNRDPLTFAYVLKLRKDVAVERRLRDDSINGTENRGGDTHQQEQQGQQGQTDLVDLFLDRYVFVEQGKMVCDMTRSPQCCLSKLDEFQAVTANVRHEIPAPIASDPTRTKYIPVHQSWLINAERQTAFAAGYHPDRERVYVDPHNGQRFVNTFHVPVFDKFEADLGEIDTFLNHIEYIVPSAVEREWFLKWFAFVVQRPQQRSQVHPLHVSTAHGTGRGFLVKLLYRLLGSWNCAKTSMPALCGEGKDGAFNEYMNGSLLCFVEEVKESSKRYSIADSIRDTLTEDVLHVNIKSGFKGDKEVFTNFFFMSNHRDALVLPHNDRRIQVITGPTKVRSNEYYSGIYKWLFDRCNVAALHRYLMDMNIDDFNWQTCTHTAGRLQMIDYNMTPTEAAFRNFLDEAGTIAAGINRVVDEVAKFMEGDAFDNPVDRRQVLKLLQQHATHYKQMKVDGQIIRPWLIGEWDDPNNDDVRELLQLDEV